jgi:hypothetical protein
MIRLILFLPVIFFSIVLSAQELTITHGKPLQEKLNYYDLSRTSYDTVSHTAYDATLLGDNLQIEIFKDYVTSTARIDDFSVRKFPGETTVLPRDFLNVGRKFYMTYLVRRGLEGTVYAKELNPDLSPAGQAKVLATFPVTKVNDLFGIYASKDAKQLLLVREGLGKILVKSFDESLVNVWSKEIEIQTTELVIEAVGLNGNGDLYLGGHYFKKGKQVDHFAIAYSMKTQQLQTTYFPMDEGLELFNFNMSALQNGEPLVACMYSKKRERGYRLYKIEEGTLKFNQFATRPLSDEFKSTIRLGYKDETLHVTDIATLKNGNVILLIEGNVYHQGEDFKSKYGNFKTHPTYYASPTNVICINPTGTPAWDKTVRKFQQQASVSYFLGHYFFHGNNKVYVVYNDVNENFNLNPFAPQKGWVLKEKNMYVAIAEIDEHGNAKKLNLVSKNPTEVSYFMVDKTMALQDYSYRFKLITARGTHYSILKVNP